MASDALFVTLDPLVRQVRLPDQRELLVSDTVGFIDRLPHALVAAFRATLEEVAEADLVLHVIDAASPERERHMAAVRRVLEEVGATDVPIVDVYNKVDAITPDERRRLRDADPAAALISARDRRGGRRTAADGRVARSRSTRGASPSCFDSDKEFDRQQIARLYRVARVVSHVATNGRVVIEADVPRRFIERLTTASWRRPMHRNSRRGVPGPLRGTRPTGVAVPSPLRGMPAEGGAGAGARAAGGRVRAKGAAGAAGGPRAIPTSSTRSCRRRSQGGAAAGRIDRRVAVPAERRSPAPPARVRRRRCGARRLLSGAGRRMATSPWRGARYDQRVAGVRRGAGADPRYVPALVGRGQALLALNREARR